MSEEERTSCDHAPEETDGTLPGWRRTSDEEGVATDPRIGTRIGPFLLKEHLGRGGMGTVYLAEQLEPVKRPVALKLLRGSLLDPTHVARFNIEQQALAHMSHPAIAQVYDAGTTHDGRPFFAMEYVAGSRSPSSARPEPRAEATSRDLRQGLLGCSARASEGNDPPRPQTQQHPGPAGRRPALAEDHRLRYRDHRPALPETNRSRPDRSIAGTPPYMSPEQADTTSPTWTPEATSTRWARCSTSCSRAPPRSMRRNSWKPRWSSSARCSTTLISTRLPDGCSRAEEAQAALADTTASAAADAAAEIRDRRHRSQGHGQGPRWPLPSGRGVGPGRRGISRGPARRGGPTPIRYRLGKLASRHKALIAARRRGRRRSGHRPDAGHLAGFLQARQQRDRALEAEAEARTEAVKAEQTAGFIMGILSGIDPAVAGSMDKTLVRRLLEDAAERIGTELADQPEVAATIHYTIGTTFSALGEYDPALEHITESARLLELELGRDDPSTLTSLVELSLVNRRMGRFEEAEQLLVEATDGLRESLGHDHANTLSAVVNLASLQMLLGRFEEAEILFLEALETCREVLGDDSRDTLTVANNLGLLYSDHGKFELAEPLFLEVLEKSRDAFGTDHPDTLNSINNLAALYEQQGRYQEAEGLYLEAIDGSRRVMGADHPETLNTMNNLAVLYSNQGRLDEAEKLDREVLEASRRVLGPDHPDTLNSMNNLATVREEGRALGRIKRSACRCRRGGTPQPSARQRPDRRHHQQLRSHLDRARTLPGGRSGPEGGRRHLRASARAGAQARQDKRWEVGNTLRSVATLTRRSQTDRCKHPRPPI